MKTIQYALLMAIVFVSPVQAADIRQGDLEKLWAKYAVRAGDRPRMGCLCFDGTANQYRLGHVIGYGFDGAACYFSTFNPDGTLGYFTACLGPFAPLTR